MARSETRTTESKTNADTESGHSDINILIVFGPPHDPEARRRCSEVAEREAVDEDEAWVIIVHEFLEGMINNVETGATDLATLFSQYAGVPVVLFGAAPTRTFQGGGVLPSLWIDARRVYDANGREATDLVCDQDVAAAVAARIAETLDTEWVHSSVLRSTGSGGRPSAGNQTPAGEPNAPEGESTSTGARSAVP